MRDAAGDLGLGHEVGECHRLERDMGAADPHQGAAEVAPPDLTVVDDRSINDLDPGIKPVGKPERTRRLEFFKTANRVRWRVVVVTDPQIEREPSQPSDRFRRDPGHRCDRRLNTHHAIVARSSSLTPQRLTATHTARRRGRSTQLDGPFTATRHDTRSASATSAGGRHRSQATELQHRIHGQSPARPHRSASRPLRPDAPRRSLGRCSARRGVVNHCH